jgi:hypothetical protein
MVVVVTDSILVQGRRPSGLDSPDEALLGQDAEGVVHRLSRDGTDLGANVLDDVVHHTMGPTRHRSQHGQALSRDLESVFAKHLGSIVKHDVIIGQIWTVSRSCLIPIELVPAVRP